MEVAFQKNSKLEVKYTKSSFDYHNFTTDLSNDVVLFQVIKMLDSVYIYIGYSHQPNLSDISLAMKNMYSSVPVSTRLLGDTTEETSKNIATKLCKKLNKVVYVSLNIEDGKLSIPVVERRIHDELTKFPEKF